jgi:excisionase family DNA binding protein
MKLLTLPEVVDALKVSESTVRRRIREGSLTAIRIGRQLRVRPEDLEAFLRLHEVNPGEAPPSGERGE